MILQETRPEETWLALIWNSLSRCVASLQPLSWSLWRKNRKIIMESTRNVQYLILKNVAPIAGVHGFYVNHIHSHTDDTFKICTQCAWKVQIAKIANDRPHCIAFHFAYRLEWISLRFLTERKFLRFVCWHFTVFNIEIQFSCLICFCESNGTHWRHNCQMHINNENWYACIYRMNTN